MRHGKAGRHGLLWNHPRDDFACSTLLVCIRISNGHADAPEVVPAPMPTAAVSPGLLEIRRSSNRRLYDMTRSKPVTLDELHELVVAGHQIQVTETASGEDITARVLTQMVLDLDATKLELFPPELLHRVLQTNETLMREFVEAHFDRALQLFLRSKEQLEEQWRQSIGLGPTPAAAADWQHAWWMPTVPAPAPSGDDANLRAVVAGLRQILADMQPQAIADGTREPPAG